MYSCPSLLASFVVICFADLKKYRFTYQFGFPALHSEPSWTVARQGIKPDDIASGDIERLNEEESSSLVDAVQTWRYQVDARQYGFFLATRDSELQNLSTESFNEHSSASAEQPHRSRWRIGALGEYEQGFFQGVDPANKFVCFSDPSNYAEHPGWMLRNLLVLIGRRWRLQSVQILCYRDIQSQRDDAKSIILRLSREPSLTSAPSDEIVPRITGWERNSDGKLTGKIASLGEYMDPIR